MVRNEDEGEQAEVVWTFHEARPGVCRKKSDGNKVTGKEEKRGVKEKFLDVVKKDMGKVGVSEKDIENSAFWRNIICCNTPDQRERLKEEE